MRQAQLMRTTRETDISISLDLDGEGTAQIDSGVGFFNHMLELLAVHAGMDLNVICKGDVEVDDHHSVEDVGIVLGDCLRRALGERQGIARFAQRLVPMDEVAALVAIDLGGRPYLAFEDKLTGTTGAFDMELVEEFFRALSVHAGMNIYVRLFRRGNRHHEAEAIFKAFALCLRDAAQIVSDRIPSSKGTLL